MHSFLAQFFLYLKSGNQSYSIKVGLNVASRSSGNERQRETEVAFVFSLSDNCVSAQKRVLKSKIQKKKKKKRFITMYVNHHKTKKMQTKAIHAERAFQKPGMFTLI